MLTLVMIAAVATGLAAFGISIIAPEIVYWRDKAPAGVGTELLISGVVTLCIGIFFMIVVDLVRDMYWLAVPESFMVGLVFLLRWLSTEQRLRTEEPEGAWPSNKDIEDFFSTQEKI